MASYFTKFVKIYRLTRTLTHITFKQGKQNRHDCWTAEFSVFSLILLSIENIYQTLRTCLNTFLNTSMLVKNTPQHARRIFNSLIKFSVFRNIVNFTVFRG